MKGNDRQKEELLRLREKINSLQDENSALEQALSDKDKVIEGLEKRIATKAAAWEEHLRSVSEAIEEAAEARLSFEQAHEEAAALQKELKEALRAVRKRFD